MSCRLVDFFITSNTEYRDGSRNTHSIAPFRCHRSACLVRVRRRVVTASHVDNTHVLRLCPRPSFQLKEKGFLK